MSTRLAGAESNESDLLRLSCVDAVYCFYPEPIETGSILGWIWPESARLEAMCVRKEAR